MHMWLTSYFIYFGGRGRMYEYTVEEYIYTKKAPRVIWFLPFLPTP